MQLRASAYTNTKASGTVTTVTSAATDTLLTNDCNSAGVFR